jgi:hypothetical protein
MSIQFGVLVSCASLNVQDDLVDGPYFTTAQAAHDWLAGRREDGLKFWVMRRDSPQSEWLNAGRTAEEIMAQQRAWTQGRTEAQPW